MPGNTESILYDTNGDPLAVDNGVAIPAGTPMIISGGSDGTNSRYILVDSSGRQVLVGAGTAGTPAGGVVSIQGVSGGTVVPISIIGTNTISGTVTANQGTAAALSGYWPVRITDGTNTMPTGDAIGRAIFYKLTDGTNTATVTASSALKVDGSAVTQPISGTVTANAGSGNFAVVQATASNLLANVGGLGAAGVAVTGNPVRIGASDGTNTRDILSDSSGRQIVVGAAASGAAVTGNPVLVGGSDGTNARSIRTATDGTVRVDPTGTTTQPVSGTVTANQGGTWTVQPGNTANTTPWLMTISQGGNSATVTASNALKVDGSAVTQPVSGTVTANIGTTNGLALDATLAKLTIAQSAALGSNTQALVGGSVTTAAPTYTTGNINPLSLTTSGALRVDGSATTQPVSGTVTANQGGTWTVQPGNTANTTPWLVTDSSDGPVTPGVVAAKSSLIGGQFNTSLPVLTNTQQSAIQLDSSGRILIGAIPTGANVIGAVTQSGTWTVTANAGTGNFSVVGTGTDNTANSTAKLPVLAAVANTAAPTWTNGNMVPLSVDTSGALRISGSISATNPSVSTTGTAPPASATYIGGSVTTAAPSYTTGQMNALSLTTAGALRIDGSGVTQPVSGTVTANIGTTNGLALDASVTALQVAQASTTSGQKGTLIQGAVTTAAPTYTTGQTDPLSLTTTGALRVDGSGVTQPVSGTVTSNQGTANTLANAWPVKVTDGTNTMPTGDAVGRAIFHKITDGTNTATVKAASTAAVATDQSLVTAFSPNSPLPTGSNTIGAVTQASGPWTENLTQVASSAVATAAAGVQKVGIVGNTGATTDSTMSAGAAPTNGYGTLAQYNTTQPAPTNTQTVSLQSDQSGNLLNFPGVQVKTGTVWNSSTTINTLQFPTGTATIGAPIGSTSVLIQLNQTSTITGGAVTFQGTYDGTNWITIPTAQVLNPQTFASLTNPYTFVANTNQPFLIQLQGFQQVRMNLTTLITGTGTVTPFWTELSQPPVQMMSIASGFNTVQGVAPDGSAVSGNPVLIGGFDGTNTQTILTDTLGRIITAPSGTATASGFAFGDVALSSITTSVVRRTTYNEQSSNAQRSIASSSASDTNTAGTGARQVKITYYDSTGAGPNTETVNLNGTTAVATSNTNICFIEQMEVVSVGSGGSNAGIITLFVNNAGGGGTIGTIGTGDNETYWAHHYTPTGKTTYITSLSVVVNGGGALFYVKAKTLGVATAVEAQITDYVRSATQSGTSTRPYGTAIAVPGPARTLMYVTTEANTSLTYRGAYDFYDQ